MDYTVNGVNYKLETISAFKRKEDKIFSTASFNAKIFCESSNGFKLKCHILLNLVTAKSSSMQ